MATAQSTQQKFKNRIFLMRHGLAESNVQHILISNPANGVPGYGLTDKGKQQAKEACEVLKGFLPEYSTEDLADKLILVSSDFRRTKETAEIIHENFSVNVPLRLDPRLRERGMGELDKQPPDAYYKILPRDEEDPTHTDLGVESLTSMVIRMTHVVTDVEKEFTDKVIVLVSHGDPLMTLYAASHGVSPCERMNKFSFFRNCDIREIESMQ